MMAVGVFVFQYLIMKRSTMKHILFSLQWLKEASTTQGYDAEQLRRHANSIEAMAQAWLNVPVGLMSTGQQLIAALNIIEHLCAARHSTTARLETMIRQRQSLIQKQYSECRLERDSEQYDIEDRAVFFGEVMKPLHTSSYSNVMIVNARAATRDETIDNYLAASSALIFIEAKSMAEVCSNDPLILLGDISFFTEKLANEKTLDSTDDSTNDNVSSEKEIKVIDEKPKCISKQNREEKSRQ